MHVYTILLPFTGTVLNVYSVYGARDGEKEQTNEGGKWQCPLITQIKRSHILYKTMGIAVGLDK